MERFVVSMRIEVWVVAAVVHVGLGASVDTEGCGGQMVGEGTESGSQGSQSGLGKG